MMNLAETVCSICTKIKKCSVFTHSTHSLQNSLEKFSQGDRDIMCMITIKMRNQERTKMNFMLQKTGKREKTKT